jgi:nucleoside-triphosphatase
VRRDKHVFLSGEIQIGKSTALRKFLEISGLAADGFLTFFDTRNTDARTLFLAEYGVSENAHVIARFAPGSMEIFTDAFDGFGAEVVSRSGSRRLTVMDELGNLEERAEIFKRAVLRRLDGDAPVVGVVKLRDSPFLGAVRAHPNVVVLTVTRENRDDIPRELARLLTT